MISIFKDGEEVAREHFSTNSWNIDEETLRFESGMKFHSGWTWFFTSFPNLHIKKSYPYLKIQSSQYLFLDLRLFSPPSLYGETYNNFVLTTFKLQRQ